MTAKKSQLRQDKHIRKSLEIAVAEDSQSQHPLGSFSGVRVCTHGGMHRFLFCLEKKFRQKRYAIVEPIGTVALTS